MNQIRTGIALILTIVVATMIAWCGPSMAVHGQEKERPGKRSGEKKELPKPDRTVEFKKVGDKSLQLHLFEPRSDASGAPRAAMVFFFGGGWSSGTPEQFYPQARYLADRGMVGLCAEYRVYSRDKAMVVDCVADAQDALLYVREHANDLKIDPNRVAAAGGSAGGHLAAAVALLPYRGQAKEPGDRFRPQALVLFNPALVLAAVDGVEGVDSKKRDTGRVDQLLERMGDKPENLSPYHNLSKQLPPTLILHGKADSTVPYATVQLFEKRAKELGADCRLIGYDGQAHGFFNFGRPSNHYEATRDEMERFLQKHKMLNP